MTYDPFRNYDAWLTTDPMMAAQDAQGEHLDDMWTLAVDAYNLPVDAWEDDHPDHAIYVKWLEFINLVDERQYRLEVGTACECNGGPPCACPDCDCPDCSYVDLTGAGEYGLGYPPSEAGRHDDCTVAHNCGEHPQWPKQ